ncbi:hypothetical protein PMAYCL1PPCAC_15466, partial [Pristionchus mayeri]
MNPFLFFPISLAAAIRIGHLQRDPEERDVILACFPASNSSAKIVTLPACSSFSGVDNAAAMRYLHGVEAFIGANCVEEAAAISRLSERWSTPF